MDYILISDLSAVGRTDERARRTVHQIMETSRRRTPRRIAQDNLSDSPSALIDLRHPRRNAQPTTATTPTVAFVLLFLVECLVDGAVAASRLDVPTPTPPSSPSSQHQYLIGFLPSLSASKGQSKHFVGAFPYALKKINERLVEERLNCRLVPLTVDSKADETEALRGMTILYNRGVVAFIGPEDTCAIEARLAAAWNLPMIAFVSEFVNYLFIIFTNSQINK